MTRTETSADPVRQLPYSPALLMPTTLGRIDYADAFEVRVRRPRDRDAAAWMRLILEGAPLATRVRLLAAWSAIGLRLRIPGSDGSILGWEIRTEDEDFVLLGARSSIGMPGQLALRRREDALLFATVVRHDNSIARTVWSTIEAAHVRTVPSLLRRACR